MKLPIFAILALITPLLAQLSLVPKPVSLKTEQGSPFLLGPDTRITCSGKDSAAAAELLALSLRPTTGFPLKLATSDSAALGNIHLQLGEVPNTSGRKTYQSFK